MPENKSKSTIIPDGIIPDGEAVPKAAGAEAVQAENAWMEFERGRVSRRQALKKLGMTSAMATFALFSVDDLARMVGKAMQQRAADNKVVEQVAKELHNTGVAQAAYGVSEIILNCGNYGVNCPSCCTTVLNVCTGLGYDFTVCNTAKLNCLATCLMDS